MDSTEVKPEIEGNMTSLTGDAMTRAVTLVKMSDFSRFKHCWKHWGGGDNKMPK